MEIKQTRFKRSEEAYDYYYRFYDFHDEDSFNRKLYLERKRTERSRKPFLLMLLEVDDLVTVDHGAQALKKVVSMLFSSTRDIDVKGWYEYQAVIGILYAEIDQINDHVKEILVNKIRNGLAAALNPQELEKVRMILHIFPEDEEGDTGGDSFTAALYHGGKKQAAAKKASLFVKRMIDVTGSVAAILLFLPLFVFIPILIKATSRGPVFFRQERVGYRSRRFTFYKFRSMHVNNREDVHKDYVTAYIKGQAAAADTGAAKVFKITRDPRVTSIGSFLRKTSLDELPQFFNVLKGDMSLVGPRPPIPYEINEYDIWHRRRVMEMRPGITGLWQVSGRSRTTFDEMVRLDLKYVREWTPWLDIKILVQTPMAVLSLKGAY